jgi:hypothetical protein
MGSLGKKKAPVEAWKDCAIGLSEKDKILRLKVGTEDFFDYEEIEKKVDSLEVFKKVFDNDLGPVDDGIFLTASPDALNNVAGMRRKPLTAADRSKKPDKIPTMATIDEWWTEMCAIREHAKTTTKLPPLLEPATLNEQNKRWLEGGVNSSGLEKLCQMEVHERLDQAYTNKRLTKTALAHYLVHSRADRHKLLKWMGSSLAPANFPMPRKEDLPDIWLRLAKIPKGWTVLADKGFDKATRYNPRLNPVRTPMKLSDDQVKDYRRSKEMIQHDQETSFTRVPAENNYERYRNETVLKGTVPYWVIALLPYVHEWAHASMNLQEPIRRPGPGNLVEITDDYWDRHCGIV